MGGLFLVALIAVGALTYLFLQNDRSPNRSPSPAPTATLLVLGPTPLPTVRPTPSPTPKPTATATPAPTPTPTRSPIPTPGRRPTQAPTHPPAPTQVPVTSELVGSWQPAAGSWAGYRVLIDVAFFGESEVVGRTEAISGEARIEPGRGETVIAEARFVGDLRELTSGDRIVDEQVRRLLQTDTYPEAEFVTSRPVALPPDEQLRAGAIVPLPGRLTLLGQARDVVVPAQMRISGDQLLITASIGFALSSFGVSSNQGLFTVADDAAFEFELRLERGG